MEEKRQPGCRTPNKMARRLAPSGQKSRAMCAGYFTLRMIIKNVNRTSVSTNAKLSSIGVKMLPAALGLRAIPSSAAAPILPCARPQPNAAIPMPNAAAIQRAEWPSPPPAALPCANASGANTIAAIKTINNVLHFFITASLGCRQEVVPGHRAAGLTLERHLLATLASKYLPNVLRPWPYRDRRPEEP